MCARPRPTRDGSRAAVGAALGSTLAVLLVLAPAPARAREIGPDRPLCAEINRLTPGEELVLPPGTYAGPCTIRTGGRPGAPIVVRAKSLAERPRLVYLGRTANVFDIRADHVVLAGLQIGPTEPHVDGVRVYAQADVTVEDCAFTGMGGGAVVANSTSGRGLTVRRNVVRDSRATAFYFGCHDGRACVVTELLVERNFVHTVRAPGAEIGYGLQVKLNSVGVIRDNVIVDTKGPGIMVYGAQDGGAAVVVERNFVAGSLTSASILIGGGPVLVRNNIAVGSAWGGIALQDYARRGLLRGVAILHNTVYGNSTAGILVPGGLGDADVVMAGNAAHAPAGAPALPAARPGIRLVANVDCTRGQCFVAPAQRDFSPSPGGRLVGRSAVEPEALLPRDDFWGAGRGAAPTPGAVERPGPPIAIGPKPRIRRASTRRRPCR